MNSTAVTIIAIDRFIEIRRSRFPSSGIYYSTFTRALINSLNIWIVGIIFGTPTAYYQDMHPVIVNYSIHADENGMAYEDDAPTTFYTCKEDWPPNVRPIYSIVIFIFQGIVPAMTLVVTSRLIVEHVEKYQNDLNIAELTVQRNVIRDTNISRTLIIISLSFTLFWIPLHVLNTLIDFQIIDVHITSYEEVYMYTGIVHMIAMSSVPLSALVYGCLTPSIRRECFMCKSGSNDTSSSITMNDIN